MPRLALRLQPSSILLHRFTISPKSPEGSRRLAPVLQILRWMGTFSGLLGGQSFEVDARSQLMFRCPDGTSILTTAEDRVFRIYDTSVHNSLCPTPKLISRPADTDPDLSRPPRCFTQPDAIHSSLWYPTASLNHPETFCFMASIRDTSIRLIDATDGRVCSQWK